jgi:ABC-2 type transport system ATP-binding protein
MKNRLLNKYLLLDSENRDMLCAQIQQFKPESTDDGKFKVYFEQQTPQLILAQIKTTLNFLELHTPTLEEAYMKLIENKTQETAQ